MLCCPHAMPWHTKETAIAFDSQPPIGLFYLDGDILAQQYRQNRLKGQKYPVITYPSGLQRELWNSSDEGGIINIFGALELLRHQSRDEGFKSAIEFASEYNYTLGRRGDKELLIFHPHSGHGYVVRYDNKARQIADVKRFPDHAMELLDAPSRAVLPELYANESAGLEAIAPVKYFTPDSNWTWYASEYDSEDLFFGLVAGFEVELGYFSLTEMEGARGPFGLPIERDLYYAPQTLVKLQDMHRDLRE